MDLCDTLLERNLDAAFEAEEVDVRPLREEVVVVDSHLAFQSRPQGEIGTSPKAEPEGRVERLRLVDSRSAFDKSKGDGAKCGRCLAASPRPFTER